MKKYLLLVVAFGLSGIAFSQNQLSLSEAIRAGLSNNFDIRIERGNVSVAELNNNWGETGIFPTISTSLNGSYNSSDNRELVNPFAFLAKTNTLQIQPSVNLNWNLLSIYNIQISKRRLEQLQAESEGNASIVIANSIQSIILGYYVAVLEKERLEQFSEQLALSRDKYNRVKVQQEIGSAITSDLLLEEGNYLTDSTNYINQQLQYQNAISNLNFLLGVPEPAPEYTLTDSLDRETVEVDLMQLIDLMESENVDVKKQYITQEVLGTDTQLRKWERYPTLSLGANYTFTKSRVDIGDWPAEIRQNIGSDIGNNENLTWGANFTVSFTLFNGGRINRAIRRAQLQENIGEIRVDRLKASLRRDLKQAVDQYNTRKQLYEINSRRRAAAKQNLDISRDKFENGSIDSFDYRTIQNNYLSASIQELQAIYNLIDSKVTLMRLTGGLVREYNPN
ncbi:MAG: TolC family outer membrane protein [Ekhidna sp.]